MAKEFQQFLQTAVSGSAFREASQETGNLILSVAQALWTFIRIPGVEPTNNAEERAVRHGVLWRKGSFGSDSLAGSRFAERIMTVSATCRQQNRHVMAFLIKAVEARLQDKPAPSLLPSQEVEVIQPA
ncbi:hypothetical protein [Candidatus Magnetaquiglobus chichijimensis]|uniref:hypothetical protein n=1 Tax=Candidatus Magnetaquiglobus chichijimensis TaxID=3141448 RepID=UPI003B973C41